MNDYYILSITRTNENGFPTWWRADESGYTTSIDTAGKFDETRVLLDRHRYDNGMSTRAIACAVVEVSAERNIKQQDIQFIIDSANVKIERLKKEVQE